MKVSRRDFLKISAGAGAAATFMNRDVLQRALSVITQGAGGTVNLVWLQGQSCTGCTISLLSWCGDIPAELAEANLDSGDESFGSGGGGGTVYTTNILDVLGKTDTHLEFHPTLMPQAGVYYSSNGEDYVPYYGEENQPFDNAADRTYIDAIEHLKYVVDSELPTIVVVEGAIPYEKWGDSEELGFCEMGMENIGGSYKEGHMWDVADIVRYCHEAPKVVAFIGYGNCGAFGGIPGGNPNPTGAKGLQHFLEDMVNAPDPDERISPCPNTGAAHKPVINISCCPAHPEHLVYTYAAVLTAYDDTGNWETVLNNLTDYIKLDQWNRPTQVYVQDVGWIYLFGEQVHYQCERLSAFEAGEFATDFDDAIKNPEKCLLRLGCRGVHSLANCSHKRSTGTGLAYHGWNPNGVGIWNNDMANPNGDFNPGSWCVAAGSPCYGCATTTFPDNVFGSGFFRESTHSEMLEAGQFPGDASGATPEYEGKGVACYTCHGRSMPRKFKEWIE